MFLSGPTILALGDSITEDTISPYEGAYRRYMGEDFSSWFGANVRWVGENDALANSTWAGTKMCGSSGVRIDELNASYDPGGQVLRQRPDLCIIHLGTNDMTQFTSGAWVGGSIAISITNLQTLLTTIFANGSSNMIVCVCKIIPNTGASDANITTWISQMVTMVAAHANATRIFTADCNGDFKANGNWAVDYMSDATHPNSAGKSVMGSTIQESIESNVTLMSRTPSQARQAIAPDTGALRYTASTGTILGTGITLDTTLPWSVGFTIDLSSSALGTNNGIWTLKTDQATPFIFIALGTAERYFEFGSSASFDRFFPNVSLNPIIRSRYSKGWHKFVLSFDGVDRTADTSYKLTSEVESIAITNGSGLSATTNQNAIGTAASGGSAGSFDMSRFTVWNGGTAMTEAQRTAWILSNELPSGPTLTRDYKHGDLSGTTLTDTTGNQNGTIGTATWITSNLPTKTRTVASARTARSTFRMPVDIINLGVTNLWDFRTGFVGDNNSNVTDLIGNKTAAFKGSSALSSVYTAGAYQADLERTNSDYYSTAPSNQYFDSSLTVFAWAKRETPGLLMELISKWESAGSQRSYVFRYTTGNAIDIGLSSNGTAQTVYTTTETYTDSEWHFIAATYNTTDRAIIYVDGVAQTTSISSGTNPATINDSYTSILIGAAIPSVPIRIFDGIIGICGQAANKSMTAAEIATLYQLTNSIGKYV